MNGATAPGAGAFETTGRVVEALGISLGGSAPGLRTHRRMVRTKAAVLIVDYPKRPGEVLFRWECSQPRAQALAENRELKGWTVFAYQGSDLTLTLFLREPEARINAEMIHGALQMWVTARIGIRSPMLLKDSSNFGELASEV